MSEIFVTILAKLPELWFMVLDPSAYNRRKNLSPSPSSNYKEMVTFNLLIFVTRQVQTSYNLCRYGALTFGVTAQKPPYLTKIACDIITQKLQQVIFSRDMKLLTKIYMHIIINFNVKVTIPLCNSCWKIDLSFQGQFMISFYMILQYSNFPLNLQCIK